MEVFRALAVLCEPPGPAHRPLALALDLPGVPSGADYTDLFVFQLYPYASVYAGAEGMLGGEACDRVAGFWRALGRVPPAEPDHLAALLGLYASLAEAEQVEADVASRLLRREARLALLWEHLLSWLPPYLAKAEEIGAPAYRAWAATLRDGLLAEAERLEPGPLLPLHLRAAPALEADDLLDGLLAPARSGMLLVRDDLARAARELDLGLRVAERRYVLRALLAQDPPATLSWLAGEAGRWAARHRAAPAAPAPIARFWQERAEAASVLLADAAEAAVRAPARA